MSQNLTITESHLKDAILALLDDEKMLRTYKETLEKEGLATLPLASILADMYQIRNILEVYLKDKCFTKEKEGSS